MDIAKHNAKIRELQTYVPFLKELIKKLEALPSNSRDAQLTKMKQLHGLLTGSVQNLKPETLEKIENVLIKLKAKLTNLPPAKSDLEISLAKLKTVNQSSTKNQQEKERETLKKEAFVKSKDNKMPIDYKDHDYRPHEELQGNLYQRRGYRTHDPIPIKKEYPRSSTSTSSGSNHNHSRNIVEDVLKKPPLSADDISNLLHETTDEDEENLDAKDISELYKLQNSLVDKMKKETDHGLVDNDYTGHNRLALKYPRKKIDTMMSPQSPTDDSAEPFFKPTLFSNIAKVKPYNVDNTYLNMKQEWFPAQPQMNSPPLRNMSQMFGSDPNMSPMQLPSNTSSVYANTDPRLRQKLQLQQKQQQQQLSMQPQQLLNNSNNYYPWYQNNQMAPHLQIAPHNQMNVHNQIPNHLQSSYYMQQQQQQQFPQQMSWGSSSTMFTDQKPNQNFNKSFNNRLNINDRTPGPHFDDSYKKFHPKLNDMVERKFYEKSKKSQHNHNILDPPKFEINKTKIPIVHDINAEDWIVDELQKEKDSKKKDGATTQKEESVKQFEVNKEITGKIETSSAKNNDDNDVILVEKESPRKTSKKTGDKTGEATVSTTTTENKSNETSVQEEKITKEWIEETLINLFKPNKSSDDSSSNILGLLSKVLDENKFNQIKTILQEDDTGSNQVKKPIAQPENKSNSSVTTNSQEIVSDANCISSTSSVNGGDDDKEMSEKDDASETAEKPRKSRNHRRNELDKLNLDIRNMFIREGVLTSTGRRMCTILKDNAYSETGEKDKKNTSEKDKKNTIQNSSNKQGEAESVRATRKNTIKNCSVVVPKIVLKKEHKVVRNNDDNIVDKEVKKPSDGITKPVPKQKRLRKRRKLGSKQWAKGVITRKQPKRKQTATEQPEDTEADDDGDETEVSTVSTIDKATIDDGATTETEDNIPDDRSSFSENSENSVATVKPTSKIVKNIDKKYYYGNTTNSRCLVCSKACSMRLLPKHYVTKHRDHEVCISRLSPQAADIFLNCLEERSGTRTLHKLRPVIKFACYFCESLCFLSVEDWVKHLASHTGEYLRKCTKCHWQSAFNYAHQCNKKGIAVTVKNFNFDGNYFFGYLCSGCNFVQLQEENVVKHIKNQHDSSDKDIKILKINLINVPPIKKLIKRGRKKLQPAETVEQLPPLPKGAAPFDEPKVLRSATRSAETRQPIAEPKIEPPEEFISEKEIIGEMEMRKNCSSSIVDKLKARFKENVPEHSNKEQVINESEEIDRSVAPNLSETPIQSEVTETEDNGIKNVAEDDIDNKSNDSEWEDFDDAHSSDSNTSLSKLQAEIETTSTKPGTLTNTLVRLLENIKAVPEKRKLPSSPENDGVKSKKSRIDFRDLLKQTSNAELEIEAFSKNGPETNVISKTEEPIKIKEEFDENIQIKTEPQCLENDQVDSVEFRIERMAYKIKQNTFPQAYVFLCLFEGCGYTVTNSTEFANHMNAKNNEFWDGYCYVCESYVRADENMPLNLELKHMLQVHLKMDISINVEESAKTPTLSLKKLPGDLLSSSIHDRMSLVTNEHTSDMLLIKPWTSYQNLKTHANCEEMLKEVNLTHLYKCMGMQCNFSTGGVIEYLEHLKNHEKDAEDQLITNPCNLDTSSWLECPYCDIFADTYYDLVQHVTEKHKNSFYQCGYCFYRSFLATNVVMHRTKHHNDLPLSILLCDKMENLPKINFEKILICRTSNIRPLHCNLETCKNKKFYALDLFLNHHTKHNQNRYLCEFCSVSVDSQSILAHLVTHGIGLFECIYCRFATNKHKKIQIHMCDKHPTKLLFSTLRMFRHPETNAMPHDIAGDVSSIYLVNFGQRLTINFKLQMHSTIGNITTLDLLENERPKVFPKSFEPSCLLNIAECTKLISASTVQILEISNTGSPITPKKPIFLSNTTTNPTVNDNIATPEVLPSRNTPVLTNKETVADNTPVPDNTPMRRLSIISAASLSNSVPSIDALAKTTVVSVGSPTLSATLSNTTAAKVVSVSKAPVTITIQNQVKKPVSNLSSKAITNPVSNPSKAIANPVSNIPSKAIANPVSKTVSNPIEITIPNPVPSTTTVSKTTVMQLPTSLPTTNSIINAIKESSSKTFVVPKSPVTAPQEKFTSTVGEMTVATVASPKPISGPKEVSEDRLEEIAKKMSVDAISSKTTKFQCLLPGCNTIKPSYYMLNLHLLEHCGKHNKPFTCYFCNKETANAHSLGAHLVTHTYRFFCYYCSFKSPLYRITLNHVNEVHKIQAVISKPIVKLSGNGAREIFVIAPRNITDENFIKYKYDLVETHNREIRINQHCYDPDDVTSLPRGEIFLNEIFCSVCKYGTKVRKNMERHLMFHLNEVPVPKNDPINPVPCLSTTERHFDKMKNLACSSQEDRDRVKLIENAPKYVTETQRFTCGAYNCQYLSIDENMLNCHLKTLHYTEKLFKCVHCTPVKYYECPDSYVNHLRLHDSRLFKCNMCDYYNTQRQSVEKHFKETHNSHLTTIVVIREDGTAPTNVSTPVTTNNSDVGANNSLTWLCNSCTAVFTTKKQVMDHNTHTHNLKSQYLCKICGYRTNIRPNVEYHIVKKHPDFGENQVFTTYSRSDEPESNFVDNSPLWRRDSNRVKNIRGILFEDEEMEANSDSNTENNSDVDVDESDDVIEVEPTGMFCCNYCNYMASYRCVKMHHNEKHKDLEFKMKRTNLTTTAAPEKADSNEDKVKKSMTMYLCAYCPMRHRSIKSVVEHWREKHQRPRVKSNNANTRPFPFQFRLTRIVRCYYCHDKYGYHELAKHVPRRHPDLPIVSRHFMAPKQCGECDFKCEFSETDLVAHSKSEHADSKCRTIPSDLLANNFLSRYINMDVISQFYICTGCNMESDSKAELEQHLRIAHKDIPSAKVELKINKLMYLCHMCKQTFADEFDIMRHMMKLHTQSCDKSPSSTIFYNALRFKNNIDIFDQIKIIFPNGLVLNKADVVNTEYGGYDHIIKHLTFLQPSPLSKKRVYDAALGSSSTTGKEAVSRLHPDDIKRLKFTDHSGQGSAKPTKSYDLSKIYTTMQIGEKPVRVTCEKFAALFDINPVLKLNRV